MTNKISKKQIKEVVKKLEEAKNSPEKKLKIMQELEVSLKKINEMVKDLVDTMKKEVNS